MRGPVVMRGYRNRPEATAEALDADGWMHSGDVGVFDDDGYLRIVDRIKELIINAAGKNMSPANIEATIKSAGSADRLRVRDRRRAALQRRARHARPRRRPRRSPIRDAEVAAQIERANAEARARRADQALRRRCRATGCPAATS